MIREWHWNRRYRCGVLVMSGGEDGLSLNVFAWRRYARVSFSCWREAVRCDN